MYYTLIPVLLSTTICLAGFERTEVGARPAALGNAYVALSDDAWAIFFNVGGLSQLSSREVSCCYSPQPFGLSELSTVGAAVVLPTHTGVVGIGVRRYGYEMYREVSTSLSYSNTLSGMDVGVSVCYHSVSIKNYGSAGTIGLDAGAMIRIASGWRWGISMKNLNAPRIGISKENLPQSFSTGVMYSPSVDVRLMLDVQKEVLFDPSPRFGFEYWLIDAVAFRGGVSDTPSQFSGGVGIRYGIFCFDYAFTTHQELGGTHQVSVTIR
ncbi:MAG: hypothetical protein HYR76_11285 [Ignavibacteria bacterium]|nr:hypothetical protein [Ignavibacteria bacterium]MBI3765795.1 hypothetical protein [Ignavibacteriales bacterium]